MLRKTRRLSTARLSRLMEEGRVFHSPLFMARMMMGAQPESLACVAAVAPKKVAKTAVARNSLRRRIYAAVRPLSDKLAPGMDIALFAKAPAREASPADIAADLRDLFVKARILR